ncbi:beta-lactamase/transpeptidase-like protein, partial [Vararia minispora EC-137]
LTPHMRNIIKGINERHGVPGMALAFVRADGPTEFGNWGVRSEVGDAMSSDTLFTIASSSKAFLTSGLGLLMDDFAQGQNTTPLPEGLLRFDWDTKVKDLLPDEWVLMDRWATEMATIHDILSHVSGIPAHDLAYSRGDSSKDIVARLKYLRPAFELRERFSYTNLMYMVGKHIIDKYGPGSFFEFIDTRIFKPLNMSSTYSPAVASASGRATENWTNEGRRIPWWYTEDDYELLSGPGGVIASAEDLAKWVRMLLHAGVDPSTNTTILPESVFSETTLARVIVGARGTGPASISGYAMGWSRYSVSGHEIIAHSGGISGITTFVILSPRDGFGIVILANADWKQPAIAEVVDTITRHAWGLSHDQPSLLPVSPASHNRKPFSGEKQMHAPPETDLTGAYAGDGFGVVVLCNVSSTSQRCQDVLNTFFAVDRASSEPIPANVTQLYAAWPLYWTTHVRMIHLHGMRFILRPTALFPEGYGRDKTPFETFEGEFGEYAEAEFVVHEGRVQGFGLFVLKELGREKERGDSVETRASVWFARV